MRHRDLIPVGLLGGLVLFIGVLVLTTDEPVSPAAAAVRDARRDRAGAIRMIAPLPPEEVRRRIREGAPGTYVDSLLGADSMLVRWIEDASRPLRVWIQPTSHLPAFRTELPGETRQAFALWEQVLPLRFTIVNDSTAAQILVRWEESLGPGRRIGSTERSYEEERGAIVRASIVLALRDARGERLPAAVQLMATMHEIGHALGLEHSANGRDVMAAEYDGVAQGLSPADVATARLLYALPPGRVR